MRDCEDEGQAGRARGPGSDSASTKHWLILKGARESKNQYLKINLSKNKKNKTLSLNLISAGLMCAKNSPSGISAISSWQRPATEVILLAACVVAAPPPSLTRFSSFDWWSCTIVICLVEAAPAWPRPLWQRPPLPQPGRRGLLNRPRAASWSPTGYAKENVGRVGRRDEEGGNVAKILHHCLAFVCGWLQTRVFLQAVLNLATGALYTTN